MTIGTWQRYRDPGGLFELELPAGAMLSADPSTEPGEIYLFWSPASHAATFTISRSASANDGADPLLDLERELGVDLTVELDRAEQRHGLGIRHIRYRVREQRPRETVDEPASGLPIHLPERSETERVELLFCRGAGSLGASAGYRCRTDIATDELAVLEHMLNSFCWLRAP